jgi:hypothetical protein
MEGKLTSSEVHTIESKAKLISLKTKLQQAENELSQAKRENILGEIQQQLDIAKLLGKSFDVNQYIAAQKLSGRDAEVLAQMKAIVGSEIQEFGGIELEHRPMTTLLRINGINERVNIFNDYLEECGILKDRIVTNYGKRYGFNWRTGQKTYPRWYTSRFQELITLIQNEGFLD